MESNVFISIDNDDVRVDDGGEDDTLIMSIQLTHF